MLRILTGGFLLLVGFVWLAFLGKGSPVEALIGSLKGAQVAGYMIFFTGLFHCLPRVWSWGEEVGPMRAALRALWGFVSAITGLLGVGLIILAAIRMQQHGVAMAALEVAIGGASIIASADQLHRIWSSRDKQLSKKRDESKDGVDHSNVILRAAREQRGRVTAAEVAASTDLHYKIAGSYLEEMAQDGLCEARVGESGTLFYYFPEFADPSRKRDILDDVVLDHTSPQKQEEPQHEAAALHVQHVDKK